MMVRASVVVPVFNRAEPLRDCLRALAHQRLPASDYEVIVVDDGSTDGSAAVAESFGVRVLRQQHVRASVARNAGIRAAQGRWVAFTDSDCLATRDWLRALLDAVEGAGADPPALGASGPAMGYRSSSPAARFADLTGELDAERYLAHPRFPFAPALNLMYRRDALLSAGGFDPRFEAYEACELHTRLRRADAGRFVFAPRALVFHRHRPTWAAYWRQQVWHGRGYGQFLLRHRREVTWSIRHELRAWGEVAALALAACRSRDGEDALLRRGTFVKSFGQRLGVVSTYWNPLERARW